MNENTIEKQEPASKNEEWQLWIQDGEIFVSHQTYPRFFAQLIIEGNPPDDFGVSWKVNWKDPKQGDFQWLFAALDFYNRAIRHAKPLREPVQPFAGLS